MSDDYATRADLEAQSKRHHDALTRITEVLGALQRDQQTIVNHIKGTFDKPGHGHRITALEEKSKVRFWQDVGMAAARAAASFIAVSGIFGLLYMGFRAEVRSIIRETQDDITMARKAPRDPSCPGCAPAVADAR